MSALRTALHIDPSEVRYVPPRVVAAQMRDRRLGVRPAGESFYPANRDPGATVLFGSWDSDDDIGLLAAAKATERIVVDTRAQRIADHRGRCIHIDGKAFVLVATMLGAPGQRMLSTDIVDLLWNGERNDKMKSAVRHLRVIVLHARSAVSELGLEITNHHGFGYSIEPKAKVPVR